MLLNSQFIPYFSCVNWLISKSRTENLGGVLSLIWDKFSQQMALSNYSLPPFFVWVTYRKRLFDKMFPVSLIITYEISVKPGNDHRAIDSLLLGFSSTESGPSTPPLELIVQKYYNCSVFNFWNISYVT